MTLLDFTVGNFGPFRDDATLSMRATTMTEHRDNLLEPDGSGKGILSSAMVFGPNAAGKSLLIDALHVLKEVVQTVDGSINPSLYNPYRLSSSCRESPVRMRVRLILDGILYDYRVEFMSGLITAESLHHYPKRRPARVFERTGPSEFVGARKRVGMTAPSRTYLAMAAIGADPVCARVREAITDGVVVLPSDPSALVRMSCRFADGDPERKAKMVRALGTADLGIDDFTCREGQAGSADIGMRMAPERYDATRGQSDIPSTGDVFLRHDLQGPDLDVEGRTLPMELESAGTEWMFGLMGPLIDSLENGKVLVIDELGAHLHPMLTRWVVKQFSSENNPNGAQLIANTHDLGLMDTSELLRRDQIWFVNKSRTDGAAELYSLSDFEGVRKDTDVMRRYLDGRFDAMPAVRHRGVLRCRRVKLFALSQ